MYSRYEQNTSFHELMYNECYYLHLRLQPNKDRRPIVNYQGRPCPCIIFAKLNITAAKRSQGAIVI